MADDADDQEEKIAAQIARVEELVGPSSQPTDAAGAEHDVVLYPKRVDGDVGIYDRSIIDVFKSLRAAGVDVAYYHAKEDRRWLHEMSAELLIALVIGIAGNAAWDAIRALIQPHQHGELHIKLVRTENALGRESQWFEAKGSPREVVDALDRLLGTGPQDDDD